jgi:hypothetical protein
MFIHVVERAIVQLELLPAGYNGDNFSDQFILTIEQSFVYLPIDFL